MTATLLSAGPISVDLSTREVTVNDRPVLLTRGEFHVLAALAQAPERTFTRLELCETQYRFTASPRWLEACVTRLQTKLAAAGVPDCLVSVGYGYKLTGPLLDRLYAGQAFPVDEGQVDWEAPETIGGAFRETDRQHHQGGQVVFVTNGEAEFARDWAITGADVDRIEVA